MYAKLKIYTIKLNVICRVWCSCTQNSIINTILTECRSSDFRAKHFLCKRDSPGPANRYNEMAQNWPSLVYSVDKVWWFAGGDVHNIILWGAGWCAATSWSGIGGNSAPIKGNGYKNRVHRRPTIGGIAVRRPSSLYRGTARANRTKTKTQTAVVVSNPLPSVTRTRVGYFRCFVFNRHSTRDIFAAPQRLPTTPPSFVFTRARIFLMLSRTDTQSRTHVSSSNETPPLW